MATVAADGSSSASRAAVCSENAGSPSPAREALERAIIGQAVELLSGPGGLASFLRRRQLGARVREDLGDRLADDAPLLDRVRELAMIQAANGYLASANVSADGTIRLQEHNCAIYHVALGSPAACQAELELFTEILGADVVREQHIASGDRCCSYRISERT